VARVGKAPVEADKRREKGEETSQINPYADLDALYSDSPSDVYLQVPTSPLTHMTRAAKDGFLGLIAATDRGRPPPKFSLRLPSFTTCPPASPRSLYPFAIPARQPAPDSPWVSNLGRRTRPVGTNGRTQEGASVPCRCLSPGSFPSPPPLRWPVACQSKTHTWFRDCLTR
jgi:hypothetical protein